MGGDATRSGARKSHSSSRAYASTCELANLDGVLLTRQFLIGWITAGMEDRILHGDETGFLWALVTADAALIVTSNIEAERLLAEENPGRFRLRGALAALVRGPVR